MDFLITILGWLGALLGMAFNVLWWVVSYLLWSLVWLLLPLAVIAFIVVRGAEAVLGPEVVRAWLRARAGQLGAGSWRRLRPALFAFSVAPFRVLAWFVVYTLWHAFLSLMWKPKWTPWQRAWRKRWRDRQPGTALRRT